MKFRTNSIDEMPLRRHPRREENNQRGVVWYATSLWLLALLAGCSEPEPQLVHLTGETMGTTYSVKLIVDPLADTASLDAAVLGAKVDARLVALNQVFSTYIPDSELSLLNQSSGKVAISHELQQVLQLAFEIHDVSDGAYDVTIGPMVNLWGFGPDGPAEGVPSSASVAAALAKTGQAKVLLEPGFVTKPGEVYIDLSSLAKGYAVDDIAQLLVAAGASRFMVEIGGEVKTEGENQRGGPWRIGVEAPDVASRRIQLILPVVDAAMATSGDYRNFFEVDGQLYSHTLDPVTGWPVSHGLASVTVLDAQAGFADAIATAFLVMGLEKTMVVAREKNLRVLAIIRRGPDDFEEVYSPAMQSYLREHQ